MALTLFGVCLPLRGETPQALLNQALAALEGGQIAQARELLETVVDQWPGYRQAHYHLGRLAFDRGDLEEADRLLEIGAAGEFPRAFSAGYLLGRTRILRRDFAGALEALNGTLEKAPGFGQALVERGRAYLFLGDVDRGLADLMRSLESEMPYRQAAVLGSQLLISQGRAEEARSLAEEVIEGSPEGDRWSRRATWLLWALQADRDSRMELTRAIGENPEMGDVYWSLGAAQLATDRERAGILFRVALDHDSENPVSLLMLERVVEDPSAVFLPAAIPNLRSALKRSQNLWDQGKHREGLEIAQRLLETRPDLVPALLLVAGDAERVGNLWQAARIYERLLDRLGPIPTVGRRLAAVAHAMELHDLALCGVEMALRAEPNDAALHYLLGVVEAGRGHVAEAIRALERAVELGYLDVRVWLRLGELYFEQMDITASIAAYERAMEIEPAAATAVRPFALSSLTTEQYTALRQLLKSHITEHPEDINTLYSLGVMSLRDNDLEDAKEYFLRLAERAPDHRQVHYNLGQIYLRQGETEIGQQEMERFREIKVREDEDWEHHNQAHFRRVEARKAAQAGDPDLAVDLYRQSIAEGTAQVSDYLEMAAANLAAGQPEDALKGYQGVLSANPYNEEAWVGLRDAAQLADATGPLEDATAKLKILDWRCKMTNDD